MPTPRPRLRRLRVLCLYAAALLREFRATLLVAAVAVAVGAFLFRMTPHAALSGGRPDWLLSVYGAWTALLGQAVFNPPQTWYLEVLHAVYPIVGFVVLGEGIVRFALLMTSRRRGEREWMKVMASTFRDHVVLCGLGHVGSRVLESLRAAGAEVVAIERDGGSRFAAAARAAGTPVLSSDMRDDAVLIEAGVPAARCTSSSRPNDDLANLEVALDARRMNPRIRVLLRFYDQRMAAKIQAAFGFEEAFSSAALAAPVIAAKALAAPAPPRRPALQRRLVGAADAAEAGGEARLRGLERARVVVAAAPCLVGDHLRHEVRGLQGRTLGAVDVGRRGPVRDDQESRSPGDGGLEVGQRRELANVSARRVHACDSPGLTQKTSDPPAGLSKPHPGILLPGAGGERGAFRSSDKFPTGGPSRFPPVARAPVGVGRDGNGEGARGRAGPP